MDSGVSPATSKLEFVHYFESNSNLRRPLQMQLHIVLKMGILSISAVFLSTATYVNL